MLSTCILSFDPISSLYFNFILEASKVFCVEKQDINLINNNNTDSDVYVEQSIKIHLSAQKGVVLIKYQGQISHVVYQEEITKFRHTEKDEEHYILFQVQINISYAN